MNQKMSNTTPKHLGRLGLSVMVLGALNIVGLALSAPFIVQILFAILALVVPLIALENANELYGIEFKNRNNEILRLHSEHVSAKEQLSMATRSLATIKGDDMSALTEIKGLLLKVENVTEQIALKEGFDLEPLDDGITSSTTI